MTATDVDARLRAAMPHQCAEDTHPGDLHRQALAITERHPPQRRARRGPRIGAAILVASALSGASAAAATVVLPQEVLDGFGFVGKVAGFGPPGASMADVQRVAAGPIDGGGVVELWTGRTPWGGWCTQTRLLKPLDLPTINSTVCGEQENTTFDPLSFADGPHSDSGDREGTKVMYWRSSQHGAVRVVFRGEVFLGVPWSVSLVPDRRTGVVVATVPDKVARGGTATAFDDAGRIVDTAALSTRFGY